MPPGTQTRRIVITVDTKGSRDIEDLAKKLGNVQKNTKSLAGNIETLKNSFLGYLSALGIRELARMSDEMQNLSNRLKIVSRTAEDNNVVMGKLLQLANDTQQSVSNVGEIYARLGSSLKAANASSESLLEITKALINSFRISGSTNTETTATIIQLSQAFASGTLRGQELRSVMLQNAELARLLRERFGKNLAKDAEAGLISVVEVLKLLRVNQDRINESAKILAPTFEQTITKALNRAQFALFSLNNEFKLSAKFAKFMDVATESVGTLTKAIFDLGVVVAQSLDFKQIAISAFAFLAVINPLAASFALVAGTAVATNNSVGEFIDKLRNLGAWLVYIKVLILDLAFSIDKALDKALFKIGAGTDDMLNDLGIQLDRINELTDLAKNLSTSKYTPSPLRPEVDKKKSDAEFDSLIAKLEKMYGATEKLKKSKEILGEINTELQNGAINIEEYNRKLVNFELYKVNREFREGKFDVFQYNQRLNDLKEQNLNREFKNGTLSVREFNDAVSNLQVDELRAKFDAGKISLSQYNQELVKVSNKFEPGGALLAGTASYLESIGTLSQNIANGVRNTFSALEDSLVDFVKRGKFNFRDFAQAVLDDLTRIIIRASIIQPIAQGILGAGIGAGASSGAQAQYGTATQPLAAKGLAFDKGIRRFATGGVVTGPTGFSYGRGNRGLMGEAGPEAILPLQRGSGGDLGVKATVTPVNINIINQSGNDVQQKETTGPNGEKTIEILISGKVKEGIMSGKFDRVMNQAYGLNRRGS